MAKLTERIQHTVEEAHILVIGAAAFIGFEYRSVFEPGFDRLSKVDQYAKLGGLVCELLALTLLLWPAAFHHIADGGEDSHRMERFSSCVMDWALLPFALALGVSVYIAVMTVDGVALGVAGGVVASLLALIMWYGVEHLRAGAHASEAASLQVRGDAKDMREQHEKQGQPTWPGTQKTPVEKKIEHVLEEVRVVLPGTQALLGFQFAVMFSDGFDKLPPSSKHLHLASLACIALSAVCLMAPPAYHRIVFRGQDAEPVHAFATRMLLSALAFLALGLAGDFAVVIRKVANSPFYAWAGALALLALCFGVWFAYTLLRRAQTDDQACSSDAHRPGARQAA